MRVINASDVVVAERQRQEINQQQLNELIESISVHGIFSPPVLRQKGNDYVLVAGQRRLIAMQELISQGKQIKHEGVLCAAGQIPYVLFAELSPYAAKEIELHENIKRSDLTWQEQAKAINELTMMREAEGLTRKDVAQEIQRPNQPIAQAQHEVTKNVTVAQHLGNERVAGARSLQEAYKISLAEDEKIFSDLIYSQEMSSHTLIHGDLLILLEQWDAHQFDCIIADPPYGMNAHEFGDAGLEHTYNDTRENAELIAKEIISQGYRITKRDAHMYMFCDIDMFSFLKDFAVFSGWQPWRTPLVWYKGAYGRVPNPDYGPKRCYELILYLQKGDKKINHFYIDLLQHAQHTRDEEYSYGPQKPASLYKQLIELSCTPGEKILDPCLGSGTILDAATSANVSVVGIELDEEMIRLARARLV